MKHATATPAAPPIVRKTTGRIILSAPDVTPHPLTPKAHFIITPKRFTLEMVQVDLLAWIPADAAHLVADPTSAVDLIFWPLAKTRREIEASPHRDEYSLSDFRLMASAVEIDHRGMRGLRPVTLLLLPPLWEDVETIARHFGTDTQAVLRGALRIAVDRKLAESRPHPLVIATRAKAGR